MEGEVISASAGACVSTAGDVNGDGYSDVVVGSPLYDGGQAEEGRAFVFLGSNSGLATSPAWTVEGNLHDAGYGGCVGTAGDVNGDGFDDVIVGAGGYDNPQNDEGRVFLYAGSSTGLSVNPVWTAESNQANAWFGKWTRTAGDVNGDGFADVIIGAYMYDNGELDEGRVFVYHGSATWLSSTPDWTVESNQAFSEMGFSAASAGDVNADGFSDVIVGAALYDNGQSNEGRAFVYLGSSEGLSTSSAWTNESNQAAALYGQSVASAGDFNGDGFSDVIVGAHLYDQTWADRGAAFVYLGSAAGLSANPSWSSVAPTGPWPGNYGKWVASSGDVNGDGYSDVLVGAPQSDGAFQHQGGVWLYLGSGAGVGTLGGSWFGDQQGASLGESVSTAGDVDGDGLSDVLVGAPGEDNGTVLEGFAIVYMSREGRGSWTRAPRQRRANDSAPIAMLGRALDPTKFRVELRLVRALAGFQWASGVTPKVRLEWQVAPLRASLGASDIESGPEQAISALPMVFSQLAELSDIGPHGLALGVAHQQAAGAYHWRARVRTNNPIFPVTPWVTIPWNNVTEAKLRTSNNVPGHGSGK
jgi:hypothetical protein